MAMVRCPSSSGLLFKKYISYLTYDQFHEKHIQVGGKAAKVRADWIGSDWFEIFKKKSYMKHDAHSLFI